MIQIVNWCGDSRVREILQANGYEDRQEVHYNPYEMAEKLFDAGLNVMMLHGNPVIIAVDTRSFQQR